MRRLALAAAAFAVLASAVALAAPPPADAQPLEPPVTAATAFAACPDDPWECLPAWRWGGIDFWGPDMVATGGDWGWLSFVSKLLNKLINFGRTLPFMAAKAIWWVTLKIIKFVADPSLIPGIYDRMIDGVKDTWTRLMRFLGVPGAGGGSVLWGTVLMIALFYSVWLIVRPRPGSVSWTEINTWSTGAFRLAATVISFGLLALMMANIDKPSSMFHPMKLMAYPAELLNSAVMGPLASAAGELGAGPPEVGADAPSACHRYEKRLTAAFDLRMENQDIYDSAERARSEVRSWSRHWTFYDAMVDTPVIEDEATRLTRGMLPLNFFERKYLFWEKRRLALSSAEPSAGGTGTEVFDGLIEEIEGLEDDLEGDPGATRQRLLDIHSTLNRVRIIADSGMAYTDDSISELIGMSGRPADAAADDAAGRVGLDFNPSAYVSEADVGARTAMPKMVSEMWQSGYLSLLGTAQFSDPEVADRATCYLMEWLNWPDAPEQRLIMYESLGVQNASSSYNGKQWKNQADDMFNPGALRTEQQRSLLTLASACGFAPSGNSPTGVYRANTPGYGTQTATGFNGAHVWLYKEWSGIKNYDNWAGLDDRLTADVCLKWMFPNLTDHDEDKGVKSDWVQERAALEAEDAEEWAEDLKPDRLANSDDDVPSAEDAERVFRVLEAIEGTDPIAGLVYGVWAVVVALAYLKAFGGLSVGFLVAQLILAILFFMLPLLLFVSGLPIEAAGQVRKKLIRLYLATVLSYALFYTVLMMVMLLTDIVSSWLEAMTGGDGFAHMMLIAASPLIALWMLSKGLKLFGMGGMLSVQGAAQLSSGLSAAGMRLPDMKDVAAKTTSVGLRAASIGMKTGSIGMKTTRAGVGATIAGVKGARSVHSDYRQGQARGLTRRNAFSQVMADRARSAYGSVSREAGDFAGWAVTGAGRYVDRTSRLPSVPRPWAERGDQIRAAEAEIADIDRRLGNETGPDPDPPPSGGRPLRTAYQAARDRWNLPEDSNPPSGRPIPDPDPPPSNPPSSGGVLRTAYQAALDNYPDPQPILGPNGRPAGGGNPDPQPILGPNGRPAGGGNPDPQPILGPNGRPAGGGNPDPQPILGPNGRPAGGGNPDPSSRSRIDPNLVATVSRYVRDTSNLTAHNDYLDRQQLDRQQGALDARRQALQDRRRTLQDQIDDTKKIWGRNTDSRGSSRDSKADGNREITVNVKPVTVKPVTVKAGGSSPDTLWNDDGE